MSEVVLTNLLMLALFVCVFGFLVMPKEIPGLVRCVIAAVKVLIPLTYFALCTDKWFLLDDVSYFQEARKLLSEGLNPFTLFFHSHDLQQLFISSGGKHILYLWWNMVAEYLGGPYYYAPVFFNVALTFLAARMLHRLVLQARFDRDYARYFTAFFLLHWDILSWSSVLNLKDIVILTLTVTFFALLVEFREKRTIVKALSLGVVAFIFLWIRFYIPLIIIATFALWQAVLNIPLLKRSLLERLGTRRHKLTAGRAPLAYASVLTLAAVIGAFRFLIPGNMDSILAIVFAVATTVLILAFQEFLVWWQVAIYLLAINLFWNRPQLVEMASLFFTFYCIAPVRIASGKLLRCMPLTLKGVKRYVLVTLFLGATSFVVLHLGVSTILGYLRDLVVSPSALGLGIFRILLTPQPWSIDDAYSFLTLSSVFHWLLFLPSVWMATLIWRRSPELKLLLLYLMVCLFLYGGYEELQGPRHRLQFTFIIAWLQFDFLWRVIRGALKEKDAEPMKTSPAWCPAENR